jgi:hypothetical protein
VGAPGGIVHVVLYAGKLGGPKGTHSGPSDSAFAFDWPKNHRASAIRNGLLREKRTEAVFLGRFRWAGRSGSLVLAPPEELGGIVGDHIVFRWREGNVEYALSLHAWEPFIEAVASLRAVTESAAR